MLNEFFLNASNNITHIMNLNAIKLSNSIQ